MQGTAKFWCLFMVRYRMGCLYSCTRSIFRYAFLFCRNLAVYVSWWVVIKKTISVWFFERSWRLQVRKKGTSWEKEQAQQNMKMTGKKDRQRNEQSQKWLEKEGNECRKENGKNRKPKKQNMTTKRNMTMKRIKEPRKTWTLFQKDQPWPTKRTLKKHPKTNKGPSTPSEEVRTGVFFWG